MANLPISLLPELTALTSNAEFVVAQSGTTYKVKNSVLAPFPTVYGLFAQTGNSASVSATTVQTTIIDGGVGTLTVGPNQFRVGDSFRVDMGGVLNAANNQTIRIRAKAGTTIFLDSGTQTLANSIVNDIFSLSINFTIRKIGVATVADIVSLGRFTYAKSNNGTVEGFGFNSVNNTTFDTTISNTLDITVEWGAINSGNNIYSDFFVLNKIY